MSKNDAILGGFPLIEQKFCQFPFEFNPQFRFEVELVNMRLILAQSN